MPLSYDTAFLRAVACPLIRCRFIHGLAPSATEGTEDLRVGLLRSKRLLLSLALTSLMVERCCLSVREHGRMHITWRH
ncbi:hypothetical protein cyc_01663 [Cyclospora cayetanensis]|uniref:Uncharacterized protein n=1 Tax=Cyclospora cayetanensis TaxID=88456 RepID=A0A1D3D5C4_9EIME|nr:hypothetical protein cyc_01663 [Cyclospora cayetanensis]